MSPADSKESTPESPASSAGEQISQMSAAPFSGASFFSALGLIPEAGSGCGECLACGYKYTAVEELADHQRVNHGLAEVIF